jgi:ferrous iron transport protein A
VSLNEVIPDKTVVIDRIDGGRGVRRKLMDLGLIPGVPVRMVNSDRGGPLVISVMGRDVALGRGMASRVIVR